MSDLEKDIMEARSENHNDVTYDVATVRKIQKKAGEIIRKYERDMATKLREEKLDEHRYCLYS